MRIYDFKCPKGHVAERLVHNDVRQVVCPECALMADRQISAPAFHLDGASGHFPGAASKWEREHERLGRGSHYQDE